MTKKEVLLSSFDVPFYNDLEKMEIEMTSEPISVLSSESIPNNSINLSIRTSKNDYQPGEPVKLQISATDQSGNILNTNYSISVIDEGLIGSDWSKKTISLSQTDQLDSEVVQYLDNNLYVKGMVMDANGSSKRINQLGVFDGQSNQMHLARSSENGEFALFLPVLYGQRAIQFAGYISNEAPDIKVSLSSDAQNPSSSQLVFNENVRNYLDLSRKRKKIFQYYKSLEYDITSDEVKDEIRSIKPDKSYDISKFVEFESVGKFFDEIISAPLKFTQQGDEVKAVMFDPEGFKKFSRKGGSNNNFPFSPVFIIDGKLTKDANHVYNMSLNGVTTIELYNSIKTIGNLFGNFRNYGIVKINTELPEVSVPDSDQEDIHRFNGLQPASQFADMKSINNDIPQLRPLVYWNANANSTQTQKANISFNASDDISNFKIIVVGQTENGQMVKGETKYSTVLGASND